MAKKIILSMSILVSAVFYLYAQLQVGDPGVTFDQSKFDPDYTQMEEWITAGVRGGIPFVDQLTIKETLNDGANSSAINSAINAVANQGGGAVLLKNGTYDINDEVDMKTNVSLVGESREGVKCIIDANMTANSGAFQFLAGVKNSGIYRLTIEGGWGKPEYDWNIGTDANDELPGNENISVFLKDAEDCWIDDCDIINSADFPVRCVASHITLRNLHVDGVFNKHGGCHGYFFLLGRGYNLVTGCYITHLRHISLQGDGVRYNVVYDNDLEQEVSFHSDDDGDNLIEKNKVTLPEDMPGFNLPNYYAIMGPWSIQHEVSKRPNYLYKNKCLELNNGHNGATPWSDDNKIYSGPIEVKPPDPHTNFPERPDDKVPIGGTLYPVVLDSTPVINSTPNVKQHFSGPVTVTIYTLNGRLLKGKRFDKLPFENHRLQINNNEYSPGLYIIHVEGNGLCPIKRVVYLED